MIPVGERKFLIGFFCCGNTFCTVRKTLFISLGPLMDNTLSSNFLIVVLSFPRQPVIITLPFSFNVEDIVFMLSSLAESINPQVFTITKSAFL